MQNEYPMMVVTGAAGFIGSHMIKELNKHNFNHLVVVDHFRPERAHLLEGTRVYLKIDRDAFPEWLEKNGKQVEFVFHLGARTDTLERDEELLDSLNTHYSKLIWKSCTTHQIPLIYASSAATYGAGEMGFEVNHETLCELEPLNAYAKSKHAFDLWALRQHDAPFYWAGLKFFNVYGPDEDHKGNMASMVFQMEQQILKHRKVKLFKSYRADYPDGGQKRDFIHVNEVTARIISFMWNRGDCGLKNVGTGTARSFNEIAIALFEKLDIPVNIEYIEMPEGLRERYQYFTEAK